MPKFSIGLRQGDMFEEALASTIFVHSCNCRGRWGKGVAYEFKNRFQAVFEDQKLYCSQHESAEILGKCMILPVPQSGDHPKRRHYVACLFTKVEPGATKSSKETLEVLEATKSAMQNLVDGIADLIHNGDMVDVKELRMPRLNAGLFNVSWGRTLKILNELDTPKQKTGGTFPDIVVYERR